jgi:penicillin-binding protein 1B
MRVWSALFKALPTAPLDVSMQGLEWAWINPERYERTDEDCPEARRFAFVQGHAPYEYDRCPMARLRGWFGNGE